MWAVDTVVVNSIEGAARALQPTGHLGRFQCAPMATNKGGYEEDGRFSMCECCGEAVAV